MTEILASGGAPAAAQDRLSTLPKPGTPAEVRERLVDILRRDLVGPHPDLDPDLAREVLEGTSPSTWYLTGFLAPYRQTGAEKRAELADEQQAELALETQRETEGLEQGAPRPGAGEDAGPAEPPPRRSFEPSSIGLTVLLSRETTSIEARVTWGDYVTEPPLASVLVNPEERVVAAKEKRRLDEPPRSSLQWRRLPQERRISIPIKHGLNNYLVPQSAAPAYPGGGLELAVSVRPTQTAGIDGRQRNLLAVSVFLVNRRSEALRRYGDLAFCFQARLELTSSLGFEPNDDRASYDSDGFDERLSDLHYCDVVSYAIGHNSSGDWSAQGDHRVTNVFTNPIPSQDVEKLGADIDLPGVTRGMEALGKAAEDVEGLRTALEQVPAAYAAWAVEQAAAVGNIDGQKRQDVAHQLLRDIEIARGRIASGIGRLVGDPVSREAFAIMNRTMARANRQRGSTINGKAPDQQTAPTWRLFQLAFILLNLDGLVDPIHQDRATVDLLFFPTGGGKTEAYLGLAAFAIARRRLNNPGMSGAGLSVVMRYTLRLLTLDQLQRAAGLICALELERRDHGRLGQWPIEIGLWVGGGATPNSFGNSRSPAPGSAIQWVRSYRSGHGPAPAPLKNCPWCGGELKPDAFHLHPNQQDPKRLDIRCENIDCDFSSVERLPIVVVDDEIYRRLPAFMIATIDKFANVPWVGGAGAFFGNVTRHDGSGFYGAAEPNAGTRLPAPLPPIDLIIQDELHLISGPLGTIAGLYETAFDLLASRQVNGLPRGPKIVASTATVRRASAQIKNLFGRTRTAIFPPPGISRNDSFFAKADTSSPSRLYVGVASPGRGPKLVFLRTLQTLLAGAEALASGGANDPADPYLTALCYFNALRELGGARRIVDDEVRAHLASYGSNRVRLQPTGQVFANRQLREIQELTSRYSTDKVSEARTRLGRPAGEKTAVDVALATNMISVGLDIGRLGLMVVQGQPKTAAEYIQATSRVGRETNKPGLVVTLLNVHKPRDRMHYEQFRSFHKSFYRAVEATSVTPFSTRALDRALAATMVAAVRHFEPALTPNEAASRFSQYEPAFVAIAATVRDKMIAGGATQAEIDRCLGRLDDLKGAWIRIADQQTSGGDPFKYANEQPVRRLLQDPQSQQVNMAPERRLFIAGRSMRDTEPVALLRLKTPTGQSF
ncbi:MULTISPECIES: DISARM system helicase DrmA [unclassified Mesorhizobium]|uniref:DISARM system helicase DrmA n=1 Tax=unclassified Mesorhizobium TaxID=325217 RepID=UPI001CCDDE86|nr:MULTISPECIES: DISARM system helicase DrmA [unclassified Mesorhizobium]MBZ9916581.1 DISARM system helicase DrmA [Mesorhizobium sp. BR1-1-7]MBZ9952872.1 DISARM system helicase DrmA [Mesorhizobium sp. BR1-1-15]